MAHTWNFWMLHYKNAISKTREQVALETFIRKRNEKVETTSPVCPKLLSVSG